MSTKRYCCSQCGQPGHNKRNYDCPTNVDAREKAEEQQEAMREALIHLRRSEEVNEILTKVLTHWQSTSSSSPIEACVSTALLLITCACRTYRSATVYYNARSLLASIEENVRKLNRILMIHQEPHPLAIYTLGTIILFHPEDSGPEPLYRAVHQLSPVGPMIPVGDIRFTVDIVRTLIYPRQIVKRTNEYLKVLNLTFEDTKENKELDAKENDTKEDDCPCPICFDTLILKDVVKTNCHHGYCTDCIKNMTTSIKDNTHEPKCPLCRTTITGFTIGNQELCIEIKNHLQLL